jgi:hypothetical protein
MGRNLERPFKNMAKKPEDMLDTATAEAGEEEEQVASVEVSAEKDTTAIDAIEDSSDEEETAENQESEDAEDEEEEEAEDEDEEDEEEEDEEDDDEE